MNTEEFEIPENLIEQAEAQWAEERWREQIKEKKKEFDKIPINIILDTNWWIYLAKGENQNALKQIIEKLNDGEFRILTPEIIIKEWDRNLQSTKESAQQSILEQTKSAKRISEFLVGSEKTQFDNILNKYKSKENERLQLIKENIDLVDEIIRSKTTIVPISQKTKDLVIEVGLQKKAPFQNKNSMADAIIFFSAIEYLEEIGGEEIGESIFVSYNHLNFSKSKQEKDEIHPDLKSYINKTNTIFERNIGKAMKLTEKISETINQHLDDKAENALIDDHIESQIDMYIQNQIDIQRGK